MKNGELTVRAPRKTSRKAIDEFVSKNKTWIERKIELTKNQKDIAENLSDDEINTLKKEAKKYFEEKTKSYSKIMNIKYGRVRINCAKHRHGSCSAIGDIAYSYRLMLYPESVREYVVVHELAHILEFNHSKRFYAVIEKYLPDYRERKKLFKSIYLNLTQSNI